MQRNIPHGPLPGVPDEEDEEEGSSEDSLEEEDDADEEDDDNDKSNITESPVSDQDESKAKYVSQQRYFLLFTYVCDF